MFLIIQLSNYINLIILFMNGCSRLLCIITYVKGLSR